MAIVEEIHVNDTGTHVVCVIYNGGVLVSIDDATDIKIYIKKPDGSVLTKTGNFVTDGTDSEVEFISIVTDFDQAGAYSKQAKITTADGVWHSDIEEFEVSGNLA